MIQFKVTPAEQAVIKEIVDRACKLFAEHDRPLDYLSTLMDITACHANGCKLRLADMRDGRDFDLVHDVVGIAQHLDRETGKLDGRFLPRYAVQ